MHLGFEGKTIIVTGGSKGIGRAIAEKFLEEGASTVHICGRAQEDLDKAEKVLSNAYPRSNLIAKQLDITDTAALKSWIEAIGNESGIDVLVSNVSALAVNNAPEAWIKSFDTDMFAHYTMVQAAIPYLEKSKGNIIAIGSVSGRDIDASAPSPYGAFKAALNHYQAQLARILAPKGVRANTVSPGNIYIEDGFWGGVERDMPEMFKTELGKNPMGRMGRAEEIANLVAFTASEKASFISGSNLVCDGALCNGVQF